MKQSIVRSNNKSNIIDVYSTRTDHNFAGLKVWKFFCGKMLEEGFVKSIMWDLDDINER